MQNTGNLTSLAERIRAKTEQDAQEIENLTRQQFENLSRSLSASSKTALSTTENAIRSSIAELEKNIISRCQSLGAMFNRKYLYSILLSAGILLLTVFTCWGLIALYRYQITDLQQEIVGIKAEKATWDRDFPLIQRAFSGLELYQSQGKNYLLLWRREFPDAPTLAMFDHARAMLVTCPEKRRRLHCWNCSRCARMRRCMAWARVRGVVEGYRRQGLPKPYSVILTEMWEAA
ncbi:MAG: hypothetical protein FWG17_05490 [Desulfovibrionaceae bacterium]|nr:hypothetical protein [Desulfovibrionaceae bacterium]